MHIIIMIWSRILYTMSIWMTWLSSWMKELTLRDMAFYVAYEEMNVSGLLCMIPIIQTSIGISTQTVNLSVLQRVKQLCPWPFTMRFYEMAKKESITLTDDESSFEKFREGLLVWFVWYRWCKEAGEKGYLFVHGKVCNSPEISGKYMQGLTMQI